MVLKGSRDQAGGYDCSRERVRTMYGNVYTQHKYNFRLVEYGGAPRLYLVYMLCGVGAQWFVCGAGGSRAVKNVRSTRGQLLSYFNLILVCIKRRST